MSLRILPAAYRDIADIESWVMENFGPSFVASTRAILLDTFRLLEKFQHLGTTRPDVTSHAVRFYSLKHYWIATRRANPCGFIVFTMPARDLSRLRLPS